MVDDSVDFDFYFLAIEKDIKTVSPQMCVNVFNDRSYLLDISSFWSLDDNVFDLNNICCLIEYHFN